jgi:RNA polymerase sigma-70 factor (ECF subfamily)
MAMLLYRPGRSAPRLVASSRNVTTGNAVDAALVARIADADRAAMRIMYTRHHARIRRFILHFVISEEVADALAHDVFLHVWRNADRFAGPGPVSTWLLCVARQKTLGAAARSGRHRRNRDAASTAPPVKMATTEGRVP